MYLHERRWLRCFERAEDRSKFSEMCDRLNIGQPRWRQFTRIDEALDFCHEVKFPVLVRPSYVLSGAVMQVIDDGEQLRSFLEGSAVVEQEFPVVLSKYISGAREIEFDAVACHSELINCDMMSQPKQKNWEQTMAKKSFTSSVVCAGRRWHTSRRAVTWQIAQCDFVLRS